MDLLLDLLYYLISKNDVTGLNLVASENAFVIKMHDDRPDVVVISEYAGFPLGDDTTTSFRNVQFKARGEDDEDAWNTISKIYQLMIKDHYIKFKDRWMLVEVRQTPFKITNNNKGWALYAFNAQITTEFKEV